MNEYTAQIWNSIQQFKEKALTPFSPFVYRYEGSMASQYTVHISSIIHGNEVGSLPTILQLIDDLEQKKRTFAGRLHISLGNPEGSLLNRRFVDADLNRLFLENQPAEHANTHEGERARSLMPFLDACDIILDLHQTMLASETPFYIFPKTEIAIAFAEAIGGSDAFIDATPSDSPPMYQCADEYVWRQGKPALTLELGEAGFHEPATTAANEAVYTLLKQIDYMLQNNIHPNSSEGLQHLQSQKRQSLKHYQTVHREPYRDEKQQLRPGLVNFTKVHAGEELGAEHSPSLKSPQSGHLLFPKYPRRNIHGEVIETLPKEIYRIIQEI